MSLGAIGRKVGMTRLFDPATGAAVAITVVDVKGNTFVQTKTAEKDGYRAVQVAYGDRKDSRTSQPERGHFQAHDCESKYFVREFRLEEGAELPESHPGAELFEAGQVIDVIGTTKGKGFQGVMKRHGFKGQRQTHGSMMHRRPGAIAAGSTPGRVFKNQKMPGHDGQVRRTTQNLRVHSVRAEEGVVLVIGNIPGAKGSLVTIRPSLKAAKKAASKA